MAVTNITSPASTPAAAPAAKPGGGVFAATLAALRGKSPDEAAQDQTTNPEDSKREDAGEDADFSDLNVSAGGDDTDSLELEDGDTEAAEDAEVEADAETDSAEADGAEGESTDSDEPKVEAGAAKQKVTITDDKGRRDIEVDFSDIPYMTKVVQQAAGARKLLAQHADLKKQLDAAKTEREPLAADAGDFRRLAGAWDKDGLGGLVRELTKGSQTLDQVVDAELARRGRVASMTPAEKLAHESAEVAKRESSESKRERDEYKDRIAKLDAKEEAAEKATFQGYMESGLEKYGFTGKLGDEAREHRLNKMLWSAVRSEISDLPDDAVVDSSTVRRLFAEQTRALDLTVKAQVKDKTKQVLEAKKASAKEAAQSTMRAATRVPTAEAELRKQLAGGNFVGGIISALAGKRNKK